MKIFSYVDLKDLEKIYLHIPQYRKIIEEYRVLNKYLTMNSNLIIHKDYLYNFYENVIDVPLPKTVNKLMRVLRCHSDKKKINNFIINSYYNTIRIRDNIIKYYETVDFINCSLVTIDNHTFNETKILEFLYCDNAKLIKCYFNVSVKIFFINCFNLTVKDIVVNYPSNIVFEQCSQVLINDLSILGSLLSIKYLGKDVNTRLIMVNTYINSYYSGKIIGYNRVYIEKLFYCANHLTISCEGNENNEIVLLDSFFNSGHPIEITGYKTIIITDCLFTNQLVIDEDSKLYINNELTNVEDFNSNIIGYQDEINENKLDERVKEFIDNIFVSDRAIIDAHNYNFINYESF